MRDCRSGDSKLSGNADADLARRKVHQEATALFIVAHVSLGCVALRNATIGALADATSDIEHHLQRWEGLAWDEGLHICCQCDLVHF